MVRIYNLWIKAASFCGLLICAPIAAFAAPPTLAFPVDCTPGVDCWVRKYVDLDPSKGRRDYAGGTVTGDGHKGTDIGLRNEADIARRVAVMAAAAGRVVGIRDQMPDQNVRDHPAFNIAGKECGNGVRIDHGEGWTTQYCHLQRGSVAVQVGETVAVGQQLGTIGLSGSTEFPHVHMTLAKNGVPVDPFNGATAATAATEAPGSVANALWDAQTLKRLTYDVPAVIDLGITGHVPNVVEARRGQLTGDDVDGEAAVMAGWLRAFGVAPGDRLRVELRHKGASLSDKTIIFDRSHLKYFLFIGRKRPAGGWPAGSYEFEATLERDLGKPGYDGVRRYVVTQIVAE